MRDLSFQCGVAEDPSLLGYNTVWVGNNSWSFKDCGAFISRVKQSLNLKIKLLQSFKHLGFRIELCCYIRSPFMFTCVSLSCLSVFCVNGTRYPPCSSCRLFCVVSFHVVYFVLFVSVGISFCLEVRPMLGWKASGMNSWKGRVLSGRGGGVGAVGLGIYSWWNFSRALMRQMIKPDDGHYRPKHVVFLCKNITSN